MGVQPHNVQNNSAETCPDYINISPPTLPQRQRTCSLPAVHQTINWQQDDESDIGDYEQIKDEDMMIVRHQDNKKNTPGRPKKSRSCPEPHPDLLKNLIEAKDKLKKRSGSVVAPPVPFHHSVSSPELETNYLQPENFLPAVPAPNQVNNHFQCSHTFLPAVPAPNQVCQPPRWKFDVDRFEAERLVLQMAMNGAFMIRNSSSGGSEKPYTLTLSYDDVAYHLHIRRRQTQPHLFSVGSNNNEWFPSLQQLVDFYKRTTLRLAAPGSDCIVRAETMLTIPPPK